MHNKLFFWAVILFFGLQSSVMAKDSVFNNFAANDALGQMHQSMRDSMMPSAGSKRPSKCMSCYSVRIPSPIGLIL